MTKRRCFNSFSRFLCVLFLTSILSSQVVAAEVSPVVHPLPKETQLTATNVLRADIIEWRYKSFDGRLYKRQYNRTRGEWIGDWIQA